MKRLVVTLPDELANRLEDERRRRGLPPSAIVREALEESLGIDPRSATWDDMIGMFDSGGKYPQAADVDEWLETHWAADIEVGNGDLPVASQPARKTA